MDIYTKHAQKVFTTNCPVSQKHSKVRKAQKQPQMTGNSAWLTTFSPTIIVLLVLLYTSSIKITDPFTIMIHKYALQTFFPHHKTEKINQIKKEDWL